MTFPCCSPFGVGVRFAASLTLGLALAGTAGAVTSAQIDDFQDGTTQGWRGSVTTNVANEGPAGVGDNALLINSGNRVVIYNDLQWTGNYAAAGITHIAMDVRHANASPANLEMRLGIGANGYTSGASMNGVGDTYVTNASIAVPNDNAWHRIVFGVSAADFIPTTANNSATPNAAAALTDVTHFRILHQPTLGDFRGAAVPADFYLDNIAVVPEPSAAALALTVVTTLGVRRRRRRINRAMRS